jgi:hypothetical protein
MSTKAKRKSATCSKIKPKARADLYMWAGDLRRLLARYPDETRVYVHLHGPSVQFIDAIYYRVGFEGKPTILLDTLRRDIPERAPPTLHDLGNILQERHKEVEKMEARHREEWDNANMRYRLDMDALKSQLRNLKKRKARKRKAGGR